MPVRRTLAALTFAFGASAIITPSFAQDGDEYYYEDGYEAPALPPVPDASMAQAGPIVGYSVEAREGWLAECRDRYAVDDGVGGAIIGGVIGGVAGNRIAGRGNRTVGTVVGAGVGAVAGAAIDRAEDRGAARDFCEDYLDRYEASYAGGVAAAYGSAYDQPYQGGAYGTPYGSGRVMWVPVVIKRGCRPCAAQRVIDAPPAPARRIIPTRRVVPDKRIPIAPTKYTKTQ